MHQSLALEIQPTEHGTLCEIIEKWSFVKLPFAAMWNLPYIRFRALHLFKYHVWNNSAIHLAISLFIPDNKHAGYKNSHPACDHQL